MKSARLHPSSERAMASAAVLLFAVVATIILLANFNLNYAVNQSSEAFDAFHSQIVEKNGIAQLVKESILAVAETAPGQSANSLQREIANRLATVTIPDGGTLQLDTVHSAVSVPANPSYPAGTPAASSQPQYFSASAHTRALAGMGHLLNALAIQGPCGDLGRLSFQFQRTGSGSGANDVRNYTVNADLFSVPLTNVDVVAYGLPSSGLVANASPALPPGFLANGTSALVVTSNNPANDPTAFPDLFNPGGAERLPYQFRNAASFSWNAYEYVWSAAYQDTLIAAAEQPTAANQPPPNPQGSVYDFSAASQPVITGLTAVGNQVTIDCSAIASPVVAIVDSEGIGSVTLQGSAANGLPFVLLIRNTAGGLGQTNVTFTGNNVRPMLCLLENASVRFSGAPQIAGALLLDRTTTVTGGFGLYGHLSFYAPANPFVAVQGTVYDSPSVKAALADLAPRVLLVSTNAPFTPSLAP